MGMAVRKFRVTVSRFVMVVGLAIAVIAGSVAMSSPSNVSAAPMSCLDAYKVAQSWQVYGDLLMAYGYPVQATAAYARADSYMAYCDGGQF